MSAASADGDQRRAVQDDFDPAFYLRNGPAIPDNGMDPLDHFLLHGWREGRDPSRAFSVAYYLASNPDVAATGINPLVHYAWAGRQEGRRPRPPMATERACLAASVPPSIRQRDWAAAADHAPLAPPQALPDALAASGGRAGLAVSVSHDDYTATSGGIQNAIADEQAALVEAGWTYLHVSPAAPLPLLAGPTPAALFRIRIRINGGERLVTTFAALLAAVAARRGAVRAVIVHHLMGHAPELVAELVEAAGVRPMAWVHDYFTLCSSYALMRNDVRFCGGPPPDSPACTVCTFGPDRHHHLPRMHAFFSRTQPLVLAPSAVALAFWRRQAALPHSDARAVPLGRLLLDEAALPASPARGTPLRIAHLGARTMHKGWSVFEDLACRFADDGRYEFLQLGQADGADAGKAVRTVPVTVGPANRAAMSEAVAEHRIDVVLCWSLWPETFCFVAHEAVAGGAFVVARAAAGNVWPVVAAAAQGCCLHDEAELHRLLASGELLQRVDAGPRRRGAFLPSGGTATLLARHPGPARSAELADA